MCLIYAKLTFLVKMHDFLATPLFTETIPQGVLIIIERGKVQYITKQKEKIVLALASGFLIRQK